MFILTKKEILIPQKTLGTTYGPRRGLIYVFLTFFLKFLKFSETLDMSSKQLGEMFERDSVN